MKKKFIQFLKDNDALIIFCVNLAKDSDISLTQYTNKNKYIMNLAIRIGFIWDVTPEGIDYWAELEDKWKKSFFKSAINNYNKHFQ